MKVTVIGAGNMGAAFVKQLTQAGHQVSVTARNLEKAQALATANTGATAVASLGAAAQADVIIVATGYADAVNALKSMGDVSGKVVIDITNPLTADFNRQGNSGRRSGQGIQHRICPGARRRR